MARIEGERTGGYTPNAIKKASIVNITQDSSKFKDVYFVIELQPEDSQYSEKTWIAGDFERNNDGTIKGNWLINKINEFLDVIGYSGGYNIRGEFESPSGVIIQKDEIANELKEFIAKNNTGEIYAYFYKEWNEVDEKAYSRIFQPFVKLSDKAKLENKVTKQIEIGKKSPNKGIRPYVAEDKPKEGSGFTFEKTIEGGVPSL